MKVILACFCYCIKILLCYFSRGWLFPPTYMKKYVTRFKKNTTGLSTISWVNSKHNWPNVLVPKSWSQTQWLRSFQQYIHLDSSWSIHQSFTRQVPTSSKWRIIQNSRTLHSWSKTIYHNGIINWHACCKTIKIYNDRNIYQPFAL